MSALWDTVWTNIEGKGLVGDWVITPLSPLTPESLELRLAQPTVADALGDPGGFVNNDPLGTAVLLAIASDARLPDYMLNNYGFTKADQHEWHGNMYNIDSALGEEKLGSLLWLLRRAPICAYTCRLAETFIAQALQPLVRQKKVSSFEIIASIDKPRGMLQVYIKAYGPTEREWFADLFPLQ